MIEPADALPLSSPVSARPCALILGASAGIGAACAQRFLAEGWDVLAAARRGGLLQALGDRARAAAGQYLAVAADAQAPEGVRAIAAAARRWRPELHAAVLCAGDFFVRPMERTSSADFERLWRLMVWAKFYLVRELLPLLAAGARSLPAAVVHLGSLAGHQDFPDETAYMSAMYGVMGLARAQDVELRPRGIRVSVVSPGLVRTELTERSFTPAVLAGALPAGAIAESVYGLVRTIRAGGYIPEIFHVPGDSRS